MKFLVILSFVFFQKNALADYRERFVCREVNASRPVLRGDFKIEKHFDSGNAKGLGVVKVFRENVEAKEYTLHVSHFIWDYERLSAVALKENGDEEVKLDLENYFLNFNGPVKGTVSYKSEGGARVPVTCERFEEIFMEG